MGTICSGPSLIKTALHWASMWLVLGKRAKGKDSLLPAEQPLGWQNWPSVQFLGFTHRTGWEKWRSPLSMCKRFSSIQPKSCTKVHTLQPEMSYPENGRRKSKHKNTIDRKFLALELCQITPSLIHLLYLSNMQTCTDPSSAHSVCLPAVPLWRYLATLHCLFPFHVNDRSWMLSL